jgi:hypothetical protein
MVVRFAFDSTKWLKIVAGRVSGWMFEVAVVCWLEVNWKMRSLLLLVEILIEMLNEEWRMQMKLI